MAYVRIGDEQTTDMSTFLKDAEQRDRNNFVRKVYGIVGAQLLMTAVVATPVAQNFRSMDQASQQLLMTVSSFVTFATILALFCCKDMAKRSPQNFILLSMFTAFEGVLVGAICANYTLSSVVMALFITAFVVGGLTAYACLTQTDFTGCGMYLLAALLALCGTSLACTVSCWMGFCPKEMIIVYDLCGVLMFSMYLVYDTQMIMGGRHAQEFSLDDYVFAAVNLYLDIINLFLYIIELVGSDRG